METLTSIGRKRAVRRFADRPLSPDHLARILDAGRRAGSSKNTQRREFVVVRERPGLVALSEVGPYAGHLAGAAAAIAIVTPNPPNWRNALSIIFDVGLAAESMMLAAWDLGIGTCPVTVYDQARVRRLLGYPEDRHCGYVLSVGYPADPADLTRPLRKGGRRSLAELVHEERW